MLETLTSLRLRIGEARIVLGLTAAILAAVAFSVQTPSIGVASPTPLAFADELRPASWAMNIPLSWLAAPPPRSRPGDAFDVLAVRIGDRTATVPVAYGVVVLAVDDRGLVLQVDEDDALAITNARGSGMQFIALLRSTR